MLQIVCREGSKKLRLKIILNNHDSFELKLNNHLKCKVAIRHGKTSHKIFLSLFQCIESVYLKWSQYGLNFDLEFAVI